MENKLPIKIALLSAVFLVAGMMSADAALVMTLSDGITADTRTIVDNGMGDLKTLTGEILFSGAIGVWKLNVDMGTSKPQIGGQFNPEMDLSVATATSTGAGTLTITLSDTGFGPLTGNKGFVTIGMGGTLNTGSVRASGQVNGTTVVTDPSFNTASWHGSATGIASGLESPFSLEETVVITHPGAGQTSGDFTEDVVLVPEASTFIAGALLLLPFVAGRAGTLRKRQPAS